MSLRVGVFLFVDVPSRQIHECQPKRDDSNLFMGYTLPETNITPENRPLEKESPIGNHHFQVLCSGRVFPNMRVIMASSNEIFQFQSKASLFFGIENDFQMRIIRQAVLHHLFESKL